MTGAWQQALARVPELLAAHVQISVSALVLAMIICLPLAIWAARSPRVAAVALTVASLIQTIPGLALLALFYPLLLGVSALVGGGISAFGFLPALLALTLYALLPILRNAVTGLAGVDPAVKQAADGLGMTSAQKLYYVEAPLAAPTIMAGIRTAAVWTIGAATLSTTVGQPSLGDLIFAGLQTQNWTLVLAGCLFSAALAISVDLLLGSRLEAAGYEVRYRDGLGSAVVYQALSEGDIDVYVDYSGTIWTNQMQRTDARPKAAMLNEIAKWTRASHGVEMLGALGFENTYAFAVRAEDAREKSLKTLDDLARMSSDFNFGTDVEFLERPEWQMVQDIYPIRFKTARSFSPTFMYPALASGEVDVISAFSSDGRIAANGFVILEDPKGAVPSYEAILLLAPKRASDDKFVAALNPLTGAITVENMREANYTVDREGNKKTPAQAARWLNDNLKE